jgi:hypothetical protein
VAFYKTTREAISCGSGHGTAIGCYFHNCGTGGAYPNIYGANNHPISVVGCFFNDANNSAIDGLAGACYIIGNVFYSCGAAAIVVTTNQFGLIMNNTIHDNNGDGISLASSTPTDTYLYLTIINNNITKNNGYGIKFDTQLDRLLKCPFLDYNNFGTGALLNSSGSYPVGITGGSNDLAVDPAYTNAAALDFSVGTAVKSLGWPDADLHMGAGKSTTHCYVDVGAVQRAEPAGGGGGGRKLIGALRGT